MRQATLLGFLAGLIIIVVAVLAVGGHDQDSVTTALTAALATIVGVLVTAYSADRNAKVTAPDVPPDEER